MGKINDTHFSFLTMLVHNISTLHITKAREQLPI